MTGAIVCVCGNEERQVRGIRFFGSAGVQTPILVCIFDGVGEV